MARTRVRDVLNPIPHVLQNSTDLAASWLNGVRNEPTQQLNEEEDQDENNEERQDLLYRLDHGTSFLRRRYDRVVGSPGVSLGREVSLAGHSAPVSTGWEHGTKRAWGALAPIAVRDHAV
jgi:hypothetical protein